MSDFKALLEQDLLAVFHNEDELAEKRLIFISEKAYEVTAIVSYGGTKARTKYRGDNSEGVIIGDARLVIPLGELGFMPRKGRQVRFGDDTYIIIEASNASGDVILDLEMYTQ